MYRSDDRTAACYQLCSDIDTGSRVNRHNVQSLCIVWLQPVNGGYAYYKNERQRGEHDVCVSGGILLLHHVDTNLPLSSIYILNQVISVNASRAASLDPPIHVRV
jgi:hypothetical protein